MKIRGNGGDADSPFITSYYLPIKPSNKATAQIIDKNSNFLIRFFIDNTSSDIIANFTTDN